MHSLAKIYCSLLFTYLLIKAVDNITHDPYLAVHVGDATVAFGGSVELPYLSHTKALGEGLPDTRTQPIPHCQANPMTLLRRPHRLRQQVATDLPYVLHHLVDGWGTA